jgi:phosphoenolpyruvate carboxykinase (GTP)
MPKAPLTFLKERLDKDNFEKLAAIQNEGLHAFIADYVELCDPASVFIVTDSKQDLETIRGQSVITKEEIPLAVAGHTLHFDGYFDQARDKNHTLFLLPKGVDLGKHIESTEKEEGTKEVRGILKGIMKDRRMLVRFFSLGPTRSAFSYLSCQLTDSYYVAHSLDLLYRQGYEEFRRLGPQARFFKVVHSQGELDNGVSKNVALRRVYMDCENDIVYSANTQYGGNTLGLKKLSMRLAIRRASEEGWLCEHMFVMGVHGPGGRKTYFTGAFPSLCGKTSTSMITGENILGDDIAYLRIVENEIRAVNVEKGMFGIIMGINSKDDPIIWKTLSSPNEIIFSNVLLAEDKSVHWIGKDGETPKKGINHGGPWFPGRKDDKGREIDPSHKNARFTLDLKCLENVDPNLENPGGVKVGGVIYGGRDSRAWMPVREAFGWEHGLITIGAGLESETTAATLGKEGVPEINPMSNLDFLSITLGRYIQINLDFGGRVADPPKIFGVNYFLTDENGRFLNYKTDKAVWLKWMELRCNGDADALKTPVGFIPRYADLARLFTQVQGKTYTEQDYVKQFTLRVEAFISKINRILGIYRTQVPDAPRVLPQVMENEIGRLQEAQVRFGSMIPPSAW